MCYFIIDIFTLAPSVVFGNIDDTLYGRFVCRLQSGAGVDDSCGPWRRNVGRRLCVQMAFNLGNAIGAYIGGLALSGGYRYPALAGVPFALMGFILFLVFYKKFQAKY